MKRILQPVAALIIGLVALQPAIGLICHAPATPCPMAFSDTGPRCSAVSLADLADLDGSGPMARVRPVARSNASIALPVSRKALELAVADAPALALPVRSAVSFVRDWAAERAESPPIYLRNRVFRI